MAIWFKDEDSGRTLMKYKVTGVFTRREFAIMNTYRRAKNMSFEEAILDALDLGIEELSNTYDPVEVGRVKVLGFLLAFLASSLGGYAFAKSKAPEILSKEWAKSIEMRLTRAEDDIQENASHLDEMEY